jgi:eukaryotic-like serine/threonine-protein kinase
MSPERWKQIEKLYDAALMIESARREAFLDQACAGDEELRREIASLLTSDAQAGSFLAAPATEVMARNVAAEIASALIGRRIAHYQLTSLLGVGGMGEIYLAEDARLKRKVAIKLLPAEFTADAGRVRRFAQEARAASALNHPNIITIHEIGEVENTHYIVTEYIAGETLRRRIMDAPQQRMTASDALDLAVQIAAALAAAHEAGITHRDIKPENVMVRPDGYVKVLDFGLAKLMERRRDGETERQGEGQSLLPSVSPSLLPSIPPSLTSAGVVMGTPRYMSPEQARGEKVDARTDIFSLGVMLYEMIAGRAPFAGTTSSDVIAAILRDEPPPLTECGSDAPPELEPILRKALRKDREERCPTANELLVDLKRLKRQLEIKDDLKTATISRRDDSIPVTVGRIEREGAATGEKESGFPPSDGVTPEQAPPPENQTPNKGRLIGFVTIAILILVSVGWFFLKPSPVLTSKDTILLADFENKTGEAVFDGTLKQALASQLQQSRFLNLFPEAKVRQTLLEMNRLPNARVTEEAALEICERHHLKALIAGSITPLGSQYVIMLKAINGQSSESIASWHVTADGKEQVLGALSQAATVLREKLGESLSSIKQYEKPFEQATTSSLEAYKAYSLGQENSVPGRFFEALRLYMRAAEIDPKFVYANNMIGLMYNATKRPDLAAMWSAKAYAMRERVSEYEQLRITGWYNVFVTGDNYEQIETLQLQEQLFPRHPTSGADLALAYNLLGDSKQALAKSQQAVSLNPRFASAYRNLAWALLSLNRYADAKEALARAAQQQMEIMDFHTYLYQIAFIGGDAAGMLEQIDSVKGNPEEYASLDWQMGSAAYAGQLRKAQEFSNRSIHMAAHGETKEVAARYAVELALRGAVYKDCRRAKQAAKNGLDIVRGRASLPRATLALALCGEDSQVKLLVDEITKRYPENTLMNSIWTPATQAAMALHRGNAEQALEYLQITSRCEAAAEFWPQYLRGQAYLKLGRGEEAAAEFQKILDHRGQGPLSPLYPLAHLGRARAAALAGDPVKSRSSWNEFLALWKDADPDLPILIEAKRMFEK